MRAEPSIRAVRVQFDKTDGKISPVNGICNGPLSPCADLSEDYAALKIPFIRFHDTGGDISRFYIDVSRVFPNFELNENDPGSYSFEYTDEYVKAAAATGARIIYRLGESIDCTGIGRYARPPRMFDKWANVCLHIIMHYNEGWANGFRLGILCWEIWNEPELPAMWADGTDDQAFRLYETAVTAIKAHDARLRVGGMAFTSLNKTSRDFIRYCADKGLPLDFFSYHYYGSNPKELIYSSASVRELLDASGFEDTRIILDEWNYLGLEREFEIPLWTVIGDATPMYAEVRREIFDKQGGIVGAAFCAAAMISMNGSDIDAACYYDGQPSVMRWCGLYDRYVNRRKPFYAFKAFSELSGGDNAGCTVVGEGIYAAASVDGGEYKILISSFRGGGVQLYCEGLPDGKYFRAEIFTLDGSRDLEKTGDIPIMNSKFRLDVSMSGYGVALITIK